MPMDPSSLPLVSVVIPCRNEVKAIAATVHAILCSDYANLEVLVVDGMSEDGTREILEQLCAADPRVRKVDNVQRLTPYAFNLGVTSARGEYVQIVGSRNGLAPDYISLLVAALQLRTDVACVGGDYQHVSDSESGRLISLAMESKFGVGGGNYRTMREDCLVDTVGVPLYRKSIFSEVGLFDESLTRNQDDDFNYRLRQRGFKILYVHAAKVSYLVRGSLKKAFQQFSQYGYFKVYVNRKHGAVTTLRQLVPPVFVAVWIVGFPLSLFFIMVKNILSVVALVYIALGLTLAGSGLGLADRIQVLACCLVLHFAYGLGYLQGLWDFFVLGRAPRPSFQRQTT